MADGLNDLLDDLETGGGSFTREQRAEIKRAVNRFSKRQKKDQSAKNALGDTPKTPSALEQEEAQLEKGKEKFLPKKRWPMKPAALDTTFADQYSEAYKTIREAGSKPAEFITSFTGLLQLEGQLANFLSAVAEGTFANEDVRKMVANGLKSYITAYIGRTIVNKEGELLKEVAKNDMPGYATAILEKVKDQIAVPRIPPNIKKPDAAVPVVPGVPKDANAKPSRFGNLVNSAKSLVQRGVDQVRGKTPDGTPATAPKTPDTTPKTPGKFEKLNTVLQQKFDVIRGKKREDEKAKKEEKTKKEEVVKPPGAHVETVHPPGPNTGPNANVAHPSAPPAPPTDHTPGQGAPGQGAPAATNAPTPGAQAQGAPAVPPPTPSAPPLEPHVSNAADLAATARSNEAMAAAQAKAAADAQAHIQQSELKGKTGLVETQQKLEHNVKNIEASKAKGEELKAKDAQLKEELKALQAKPDVTVAQLEQHQQQIEQHQTAMAKNEKDTSKLEKRQEMLGKRAATETKLLDKTGFNKASTSEKGAYYAKSSLRSANKTMKSAASSLSKLGSKLKKSFTRKAPLDPAAKAAADAAAKDAYVQKQNRANELKGKTGHELEEAKLKHAQEDQAAAAAKQTALQQQYEALKQKPDVTVTELKEKEKQLAKVDQVKQAAEARMSDKKRNVDEMKKANVQGFREGLNRDKVDRAEQLKASHVKEKDQLLKEQNKIRNKEATTPAEKAEQQAKIDALQKQMAAKDQLITAADATIKDTSRTRTTTDNVKDFGYRAKASLRSAKQSVLSAREKTGDAASRAASSVGKAFTTSPKLSPEERAAKQQAAEAADMAAFKLKQNREIELLGKTGAALEGAKFKHAREDQAAAAAQKAVLQQQYEELKNTPGATIENLKQKERELAKQDQLLQKAHTRVEEKHANYNEMLSPSTFSKIKAAKRSAKQSLLKTADRTGRAVTKTGKAIQGAVSGSDAAQAARDANLALAEAAAAAKGAVQSAASATGTAAASSYESAKGAVQSAAERAKGAVQSAQGAVQSASENATLQRAASFGKEVAKTTGKVALGVGAAAALGAAVGTAHAAEPLLAIAQYARDSSASRSAASRAAKGIAPRNVVDPMSLTAAVGHARKLTKLVLADALQKYAYLETEDEKTKAKALKEVRRKAAQKQAEYDEKKKQVNRSFQAVALLKKKRANLQKKLDALHSAAEPDQMEIDDVEHAFEMADHEIQRQEVEMQDFKNDLLAEQSEVDQTRAEVQVVQQQLHPTVVGEEISEEPPLAEAYVVPDRSHNETIKKGVKGYNIGGRTRRRRRKARAKAKARPRRAQTKQRPCGTKKGRTRFISEDCFL